MTRYSMESDKLQELLGKITQGNWRAEALGVTSDVLHGMDEICSASSQTKDPDSDMELMAEAARLAAEVLELRAERDGLRSSALAIQEERDAVIKARDESLALHRKAEAARDAEKALADYLAEGVRDLYEHSQYLDRYNKERGL